ARLEKTLVVAVARAQHHAMLAKPHRRSIGVGRQMLYCEDGHASSIEFQSVTQTSDVGPESVTVHIPPARRRSSRAAIQAAAMAGIGGEGRLARAAAMSEQA